MPSILSLEFVEGQGLVLIEGETGPVQTIYALAIAREAMGKGMRVSYVTHGPGGDVRQLLGGSGSDGPGRMEVIEGVADWKGVTFQEGALVILDSLPFFSGEESLGSMRQALSHLLHQSREGRTILLLSEMGILSSDRERLARAMADGVIQFLAEREGEKIRRHIHVPKMRGSLPIDRMIPFTLAGEGILIDPRERYG